MKKQSSQFGYRTLLLLGVMFTITLFMLGMVSASMDKSFERDAQKATDKTNYGTIKIVDNAWWDVFGWTDDKVKDITLQSNTEVCTNCEEIHEQVLYKDGVLIEGSRYYEIKKDGSQVLTSVQNEKFYIKVGEKDVNDYKWSCKKNEVEEIVCNNEKSGTHKENIWQEYKLGTSMKAGSYVIKHTAEKKLKDNIDWQIKTNGIWTTEWATWGAVGWDGAVAYMNYTFDNPANYTQDTGVTKMPINMTNGSFTAGTDCKINGCGKVLASPDASYINATLQNGTTPKKGSFGGWMKSPDLTTRQFILQYNADSWYQLNIGDTAYKLRYIGSGGDIYSGVLPENTWFHFVYKMNDTSVSIWINGTQVASINGVGYFFGVNSTNSIFSQDTGATGIVNGTQFDELRFYDQASGELSATQILAWYNSEFSGSSITLNSPIDYSNFTNLTVQFNCSASMLGATFVNMSLYTNKTGTWAIANTTTTNGANMSATFTAGTYKWGCYACDSDGDCGWSSSNRTITINNWAINSATYNTSSYETAREGYSIDVTAIVPTNLTGVNLVYNGTNYAMTQSGTTWYYSRDLNTTNVGNNSIIFNITYGGTTTSSSTYYQNVSNVYFGLCNTTLNTNYLNITFKDESLLTSMNASIPTSTFNYYLGLGTTYKTLSFVNNTANYEYDFCFSPTDKTIKVDSYAQYVNTPLAYPQRIWNPDLTSYTNTTTNQTLYLLYDGSYVTFQVTNTADQLLSDVLITATRSISGSDVTVASGTTGADGAVTFWLNPDFSHTFSFSKTGYTTYTTSFSPTQTSYTVTIAGGTTSLNCSSRGIDYTVTPNNSYLVNDTSYSFGYILTSSYWDVSDYGFNLRLANGSKITGGNTGVEGTQLSKSYNVNNQTIIYLDYYYVINTCYTNATVYWNVHNTANTQWSIKNFFTDFNAYLAVGIFGLDNFGRTLIIFIIIFITCGVMSYKYGMTSPMAISMTLFGCIFFFDIVLGLIPEIRGISHLLTYVSALILVLAIFKEMSQ